MLEVQRAKVFWAFAIASFAPFRTRVCARVRTWRKQHESALCERFGIPLRFAPLPVAALRDVDEVFLTSSGGGVLPIAKIDGRPLPHFPGPVTTRLHDGYWALHDDPAYNDPVDYSSTSR